MARLILDDSGTRRAFRVGEGKLSIGSGPGCALRLTSPDVAELHAELELRGGFAFLRPRPGVLPPRMHGQPVTGEVPLADGSRFEIGAARFQFMAEDAAPLPGAAPTQGVAASGAASAPAAARARAARGTRTPAARTSGARGLSGRADAAGGTSPVQRTRPRAIKRGMPTWMLLVLIAAALVVTFFLLRAFLSSAGQATGIPEVTFERARTNFERRELEAARAALATIHRENVSEELRRRIAALENEMEALERRTAIELEHLREANTYKTTQLERFLTNRLAGDNPPPERVRVFLKRMREFRTRWPEHPDMDWIDRHERLYSSFVDLTQPPTYTDIAYEVETLTWAKPRYYGQASSLVRGFIERAQGTEREQALELLDQLAEAERAYFEDEMQWAKYHWERNDKGKSVGVLISLILYLDDPSMIDQAARELVQLPGFDEYLRGYRRNSPDRFRELLENPRVREVARRQDLLD